MAALIPDGRLVVQARYCLTSEIQKEAWTSAATYKLMELHETNSVLISPSTPSNPDPTGLLMAAILARYSPAYPVLSYPNITKPLLMVLQPFQQIILYEKSLFDKRVLGDE